MNDPKHPTHPILLFDGVCNLCNSSVNFIIRHDRSRQVRFAPLQSESAQRLLRDSGITDHAIDSVVLLEDGKLYRKSSAALRVARRLRFPWRLLYVLLVIPAPLRDAVYDAIARRRYRWFGRRTTCRIPTPDERARFL